MSISAPQGGITTTGWELFIPGILPKRTFYLTTPEAYGLLADRGAAFCLYELGGRLSPKQITAGFVYLRLHGPGWPYRGKYDTQTLAAWAGT